MSTSGLPLLEPSWGEALLTARRRSGRSLKEAASAISEYWPASAMSLQRLEELTEPPQEPKTRRLAALALVAYGWTDLGNFGLTTEDLPGGKPPRMYGMTEYDTYGIRNEYGDKAGHSIGVTCEAITCLCT